MGKTVQLTGVHSLRAQIYCKRFQLNVNQSEVNGDIRQGTGSDLDLV